MTRINPKTQSLRLGSLREGEPWTHIIVSLRRQFRGHGRHGRNFYLRKEFQAQLRKWQAGRSEKLISLTGADIVVIWLDENERDETAVFSSIVSEAFAYFDSIIAGEEWQPLCKIKTDCDNGQLVRGGVALLSERATRHKLASSEVPSLQKISTLSLEQIRDDEVLELMTGLKAEGRDNRLCSCLESLIDTKAIDWQPTLNQRGLGQLLRGLLNFGEEFDAVLREVAAFLSTAASEDLDRVDQNIPGERLSVLGKHFSEAAKKRYQLEVFGDSRATIRGFNSWLKSESERQANSETKDERKRFVANIITHLVHEKGWVLMVPESKTGKLKQARVTTSIMRGKRRYMFRPPGESGVSYATVTDLPSGLSVKMP